MTSPFNNFESLVERSQVEGIDGTGSEVPYVPYSVLEEYWNYYRINEIFWRLGDKPVSISNQDIIQRYLRIFSTLVYIAGDDASDVSYIRGFVEKNIDDHALPLDPHNNVFPQSPQGQRVNKIFCDEQFRFCHVVFGPCLIYNRPLDRRLILPITLKKVLSGGHGQRCVLKKYKLHPCSGLNAHENTIVVKEYPHSELEFSFANEVEAYIALENYRKLECASEFFLKYYGSFTQNDKGFLLLEYADQGSLDDFFAANNTPHERSELHDFWRALSNLVLGLRLLHSLNETFTKDLRGIHQDLKPGNIFVFKDGDELSYKYRFKIGDFGLSSTKLVGRKAREMPDTDNKSSKMYGAPELTNHYSTLADIDDGVTPEADIWSLGCIFLESAVWSTCGERGRDEFLAERQKDTSQIPGHDQSGYSGSFHDGEKMLEAVDRMVATVFRRRRIFDNVTQRVVNVVLSEMLLPSPKLRQTATQLLVRFERVLGRLGTTAIQEPFFGPVVISGTSIYEPQRRHTVENTGYQKSSPTTVWRPAQHRQEQPRTPLPGYGGESSRQNKMESEEEEQWEYCSDDVNETYAMSSPLPSANAIRPDEGMAMFSNATTRKPKTPFEYRFSDPGTTGPSHDMTGPIPRRNASCSVSGLMAIGEANQQITRRKEQLQLPPKVEPRQERTPSPRNHSASAYHLDDSISGTSGSDLPTTEAMPQHHGPNGKSTSFIQPRPGCHDNDPYPKTTVAQVVEWIRKKKKNASTPDLPGRKKAISNLLKREQLFIVDDSASMRASHWPDVVKTFLALAYLVKECDYGIKLYLTSRPDRMERVSKGTTSKLIKFLENWVRQSSPPGDVNIEQQLGKIFKTVKALLSSSRIWGKDYPEISIYILTNGLWNGRENGSGVDGPIRSLVEEMKRANLMRTHVSIQFIRFGCDPHAMKLLRSLDNDLGKELNFDIVDRRFHRGNVWHMLIGSINRETDLIDEEDGSEDEAEDPNCLAINGEWKGKERELG